MIDAATKEKFLQELNQAGNIFIAAVKVGISRQTYYRWRKEDKKFKKRALEAISNGRSNMCDIAEHALLRKVKEGDISAIKYVLNHNSRRYKINKQALVLLKYSVSNKEKQDKPISLEDLLMADDEKYQDKKAVIPILETTPNDLFTS